MKSATHCAYAAAMMMGFVDDNNAARILAHTMVNVVCVLFLEPVGESHAFHHEERDEGCDVALNSKMSAAWELSFDCNDFIVFKDQIAASGFSGASILNDLGPVRAARSSILTGQEIDFDRNRVAV
jgi:hypothetical protein